MTSPLTVRPLTAETLSGHLDICRTAFYAEADEPTRATQLRLWEPARFRGVFDGDELIGGGGVWPRRITLPGTGPQPFAGVTMVAVAPGHRRRGALTGLMRSLLHDLHAEGADPLAALWASEGGIYGRFGYGIAVEASQVEIAKGARFLPTVDTGADRVREVSRTVAEPLIRELHAKVAAERIGWLERDQDTWHYRLLDGPPQRGGKQAWRFAVHPEGYALFRVNAAHDGLGLDVQEIVTATPAGHAAIWRHLLDSDLVSSINYWGCAPDEPLRHLLADPRAVKIERNDSLWVRLVDVDRALPMRTYTGPLDTVLELTDEFCPWNAGRWRLVIGTDGRAELTRTEDTPELTLSSTALGSAFLGGVRLSTLAAAGQAHEHRPGAAAALSRAFLVDPAPHTMEIF
ncbi:MULTISPECIES: GNAT family N-acetyltransferase [unclassified Crossiella]|uniref:GNAT family N-acetyltransferase n=1 Tax=unclassified Crossiella TaxID=2620835 RepID=UPI0020000452|nr:MULTISPECIES: GNAT family N-acetyltransferase [unclassified Crossiella]MCK2241187.1 GNAT family N-acetyltransferase [Crossiella sp. S99.2]MCK2253669.1 GNAT family N-acetyltransferase [Crossiella sp. S99.1]